LPKDDQRCTRWTSGRLYSKSPTRRRLSGVCANAAPGQTAAELQSNAMNSRRLMDFPSRSLIEHLLGYHLSAGWHRQMGSLRSQEGQSRPNCAIRIMSGLPPIATVDLTSGSAASCQYRPQRLSLRRKWSVGTLSGALFCFVGVIFSNSLFSPSITHCM
jgi:hypothetical protein